MQILKLTAIAAALVAASMSASAMTAIADQDLSAVAGQDGVSIAANLNINIGSFVYSEDNSAGVNGKASVSFNNIQIGGLVAMTVDVISANTFSAILSGVTGGAAGTGSSAASAFETTQLTAAQTYVAGTGTTGTVGTWYTGTDVVQFAFPNVAVASKAELLNISVGGITMGTNGVQSATTPNPSFGSFAINGLDLRGTTVWLWAH
jgi:hypothetical protein